MEKEEVIALMETSKNSQEWNDNCDKVKKAHSGGYPSYWYGEMIASGRINKILNDPNASKIKLQTEMETY